MFFDWAAQPYSTLITTFLFAPYFASVLVGDAVRGQTLWSYAIGGVGLVIACLSPIMGDRFDRARRPGRLLLLLSGVYVIAISGLIIAAPGEVSLIAPVLICVIVAGVAVEVATVLTNALLPRLADKNTVGRLSARGWALGYLGGVVALFAMLAIGALVSGDPSAHWAERLVGPFSGLWYLIFVAPLFWYLPQILDQGPDPTADRSKIWSRISALRHQPAILRLLVANMLIKDGMIALFAIGGILGAGLFGWQSTELGLFGIAVALTGAAGALVSGAIDDQRGGQLVIVVGLLMWLTAGGLMLSLASDRVFFLIEVAPPDDRLFSSPAEWLFIVAALIVGAAAGPVQASFRSELVRLAPANQIGAYFGLLAFSGRATAFVGPIAVGLVTGVTGSQQAGVFAVMVFLVGGLALLIRPLR